MKFNIITFGCKVNQYESNMMKEKLLHHNFLYADNLDDADIVIINTCTVTNVADKKCFKEIRKIKREYSNKILVVCGCSVQNKSDLYEDMGIDILLGNKDKSKIAEIINKFLKDKIPYEKIYQDRKLEFEDMQITDYDHVRAFIKIEDGCDNFCSYCIIPYVRGSVRCKDFDKVIIEAEDLVKTGHKEIVLTGIHTGHYESNGKDLSDLIRELAKIEGLESIRISSIEITELNDKFMETLEIVPKLANHLHIPLQSGSEEILKRMNRKYDKEYFYNQVKKIRSIRPDISLTTDIIVGFPYETDELFKESYDFAKKLNFAKIHVFPYSVREGTVAAKMPNQVDGTTKKERVKKLISLSNKLEKDYYQKFVGQKVKVLIEEVKDNVSIGHTSNYLKVEISKSLQVGQIYEVIL